MSRNFFKFCEIQTFNSFNSNTNTNLIASKSTKPLKYVHGVAGYDLSRNSDYYFQIYPFLCQDFYLAHLDLDSCYFYAHHRSH